MSDSLPGSRGCYGGPFAALFSFESDLVLHQAKGAHGGREAIETELAMAKARVMSGAQADDAGSAHCYVYGRLRRRNWMRSCES